MPELTQDIQTERPEFYSTRTLAALLEIPVSTLYFWRKRGIGPRGFKVGKAVRYRREHIERWLVEQEELASARKEPAP